MVLVIDTVRFIFSQMRGNFPSTGSLDFMDSILSQFSLESEHLENSLRSFGKNHTLVKYGYC